MKFCKHLSVARLKKIFTTPSRPWNIFVGYLIVLSGIEVIGFTISSGLPLGLPLNLLLAVLTVAWFWWPLIVMLALLALLARWMWELEIKNLTIIISIMISSLFVVILGNVCSYTETGLYGIAALVLYTPMVPVPPLAAEVLFWGSGKGHCVLGGDRPNVVDFVIAGVTYSYLVVDAWVPKHDPPWQP